MREEGKEGRKGGKKEEEEKKTEGEKEKDSFLPSTRLEQKGRKALGRVLLP